MNTPKEPAPAIIGADIEAAILGEYPYPPEVIDGMRKSAVLNFERGIAQERERCARIAETHCCDDFDGCACYARIAAAIRSGT